MAVCKGPIIDTATMHLAKKMIAEKQTVSTTPNTVGLSGLTRIKTKYNSALKVKTGVRSRPSYNIGVEMIKSRVLKLMIKTVRSLMGGVDKCTHR